MLLPGRTGISKAPGGPGGPRASGPLGTIKPPGSSPGPGSKTEDGWIRMSINDMKEHRWCATYKFLGSGRAYSSRRETDQCDQTQHEVLFDGVPHHGPATHSTNSYTLSARVAVPKRISAWIGFPV